MTIWIFLLVLAELLLVSWVDIKTKKISNRWFLVNLLLAFAFHFIFPEFYPWEWTALIFPVSWIVLGFLLFILNIMGAGDSKFLASLSLVVPLELHGPMFEKVVYATLVVGVVMLLFKIARDFQKLTAYALTTYWKGIFASIRSSFSYAPVIMLAWIWLGVQVWK